MSEKDYKKFLLKIEQLNKLVDFIGNSPDKYKLFINCKNHDEVVKLAKAWGFNIGSRWGEY
tara:strand:+ start:212 stop:394 length:183 start_codon:yes stop_codon:yes gene_type:complete